MPLPLIVNYSKQENISSLCSDTKKKETYLAQTRSMAILLLQQEEDFLSA